MFKKSKKLEMYFNLMTLKSFNEKSHPNIERVTNS